MGLCFPLGDLEKQVLMRGGGCRLKDGILVLAVVMIGEDTVGSGEGRGETGLCMDELTRVVAGLGSSVLAKACDGSGDGSGGWVRGDGDGVRIACEFGREHERGRLEGPVADFPAGFLEGTGEKIVSVLGCAVHPRLLFRRR